MYYRTLYEYLQKRRARLVYNDSTQEAQHRTEHTCKHNEWRGGTAAVCKKNEKLQQYWQYFVLWYNSSSSTSVRVLRVLAVPDRMLSIRAAYSESEVFLDDLCAVSITSCPFYCKNNSRMAPRVGAGEMYSISCRSRMAIDPRTPTMPGRTMSGVHLPGTGIA